MEQRTIKDPKNLSPTKVMENYWQEPIKVPHRHLRRASEESDFRSVCPVCEEGLLMMHRDPTTMKLQTSDNCTLCGTRFVYDDIEEDIIIKYKSATVPEGDGGIHVGWVIAAFVISIIIAITFL